MRGRGRRAIRSLRRGSLPGRAPAAVRAGLLRDLRQSPLRLGLASPVAQPGGAGLRGRMVLLGRRARRRGWTRRWAARWMGGAWRARATAIAFRWVWPCWSRAGSRTASCARRLAAQRAAGAEGWANGWCGRGASSEELVTRALGLQWGCPVLGMEFHNPEGLTALVPRLFVDAFGALPLRVAAGKDSLPGV